MQPPKSRRDGLCLAAVFVLASVAESRIASADVKSRTTPVVAAIRKAQASVVNISSEKKANSSSRWPFSGEENQRPRVNGMGSGVIFDERGYILTNQHVVDKVQSIEARLFDGSVYPAKVVQQDKEMDVAVLKIEAGRLLQAVEIGTSSDLMVGESVITIGNAFGYEDTSSIGIISALKRDVTLSDEQVYRRLIQTDACINPGNSGGPLINIDGQLIGINVATRSGAQGIGFALPIDDVKRVAAEMMSTRRLASTWHGLITSENDRKVLLQEVQAGSPAAESGFRQGDHIMKVGDLAVFNPLDVERALLDVRPGKPTKVLVRRGDKSQEIALDLKPLGRQVAQDDSAEVVLRTLGVKVVPVRSEYVVAASDQLHGGLYVLEVTPNSPASRASIQKGDILVGMNVGARHLETIRPDNVVYILRRPEVANSQSLPFYFVRRNSLYQGLMVLTEATAALGRLSR